MKDNKINQIRNFSIVAHIDHGKSTLADRIIQMCGGLQQREMTDQVLDSMDIERERGITIKAQTVRLLYKAKDNKEYILNLIDTPGHVDFSYEVSRSLAACEGSILVVDASQGVEAQTMANVYKAIDANHEIIPVLNKIDLPASDPEHVRQQIEEVIGLDATDAISISAKTGFGVDQVLEAIVQKLPPPKGDIDKPLKAMLVDSWYDVYLGVVILVRIIDGVLQKNTKIRMMSNNAVYNIDNIGVLTPKKNPVDQLLPGEVGYFTASIKQVADCKVGDTITEHSNPCGEALPGFKPSQPVVFCGLYPSDTGEFVILRESLAKLRLNDASFEFEPESSTALGFGFRCGFLGLLHLEIIQERLEREFNLNLIATAPSVIYQAHMTNGTITSFHNPSDMPDPVKLEYIEEPWIQATIMVPDQYLGAILQLCEEKRGIQIDMNHTGSKVLLTYSLPLNEVIFDFYDKLKSCSSGYASFDWYVNGYERGDVVKLSILINGEAVDALSIIVHKSRAEYRGREICKRLKELIPRHLFQIPIQAAIGGKIIARETINALRKDVTAKCYGGDISRKRKLLDKQKDGKKKMGQIGKVSIPKSAFIASLKLGE